MLTPKLRQACEGWSEWEYVTNSEWKFTECLAYTWHCDTAETLIIITNVIIPQQKAVDGGSLLIPGELREPGWGRVCGPIWLFSGIIISWLVITQALKCFLFFLLNVGLCFKKHSVYMTVIYLLLMHSSAWVSFYQYKSSHITSLLVHVFQQSLIAFPVQTHTHTSDSTRVPLHFCHRLLQADSFLRIIRFWLHYSCSTMLH